jgi:hypothetical protein
MKRVAVVTALLGGLCVVLIHQPYATAQDGHTFVTPSDLKWTDVPALGAGAKIAVIEGPLNEAVPFTFRIKLPADFYASCWCGFSASPQGSPMAPRTQKITSALSGRLSAGVGSMWLI